MKIVKCKKCGNEYEGNFCSNCGYNGKQNKKKKGCGTAILIVISLFVFAAIMGILFGEETPNDTGSDLTSISESNIKEDKTNLYEVQKDLITFEGVEADFVKLYDPKSGVTAFAIALNLKNNGSEEVTVSLSDGYVNDTKVQFMSGLPVTIAPGKKAVGVYVFGYDGLGFSKIEEIEKMEFKIALLNSNWDNLKTSEKVELKFK